MYNQSILQRLRAFQKEIEAFQAKTLIKDYTVNEIRFICERSIMLIKNYNSKNSEAPKAVTLFKLQAVLELIELYYIEYNKNNRISTIPFRHISEPALEALNYFMTSVSQPAVESVNNLVIDSAR